MNINRFYTCFPTEINTETRFVDLAQQFAGSGIVLEYWNATIVLKRKYYISNESFTEIVLNFAHKYLIAVKNWMILLSKFGG